MAHVFGCVGAKEKQQIYDAFENIYAVLKMFRKGDVPDPTSAKTSSASVVSYFPCSLCKFCMLVKHFPTCRYSCMHGLLA